MNRTAAHLLADHLLGEPLIGWINKRRPQQSWHRIAMELRDTTQGQVDLTPQTLRTWHADAELEAAS